MKDNFETAGNHGNPYMEIVDSPRQNRLCESAAIYNKKCLQVDLGLINFKSLPAIEPNKHSLPSLYSQKVNVVAQN